MSPDVVVLSWMCLPDQLDMSETVKEARLHVTQHRAHMSHAQKKTSRKPVGGIVQWRSCWGCDQVFSLAFCLRILVSLSEHQFVDCHRGVWIQDELVECALTWLRGRMWPPVWSLHRLCKIENMS